MEANLQSLPDHLPGLVSHIVSRASVTCGEALVKTALACILCARRPLHPGQLQRLVNAWLAAHNSPDATRYFTGGLESLPAETPAPTLTTLALHVLLSQLQPLLAGFETVDESKRGGKDYTDGADDAGAPRLFSGGAGLRICSSEVASLVRTICFSSGSVGGAGGLSRFSASRRMGYTRAKPTLYARSSRISGGGKAEAQEVKPPKLEANPSEEQTHLLLLSEQRDDIFDKVYYAVSC